MTQTRPAAPASQYPARTQGTSQGSGGDDRGVVSVPNDMLPAITKTSNLDVEQVHQFVVCYKDNKTGELRPYVNTAGRRFKMDQRFGAGNYEIIPRLPSLEDYNFVRKMMGVKQDDPFILVYADIFVDGTKKATGEGTASLNNVRYAPLFHARGLEIATTRAINRAMGMLIANGFSDPSMVYAQVPTGGHQGPFLRECAKYKKALGDATYYAVLEAYGVQHANDPGVLSDTEMMQMIMADFEKAGSEVGKDTGMDLKAKVDVLYGEELQEAETTDAGTTQEVEQQEGQQEQENEPGDQGEAVAGGEDQTQEQERGQPSLFGKKVHATEQEKESFLDELAEAVARETISQEAAAEANRKLHNLSRDYVLLKTKQLRLDREMHEAKEKARA